MFAVTAKPEQGGDDHLRAATGAGARHGVTHNLQTRGQIRAIHGMGFHAITSGFVRQIAAGKFAVIWRRVGVMVVGNNEHERQFFNGGLIERLMKRAGGRAAIADAGRANRAGDAFHAAGEQHAVHNGNHCAEMTDHRQITFLGPAAVNVAVASTHRAEHGTQIRSHGVNHRLAKRQPSGRVADQRCEHVGLFQRQTDGNAQGFLTAANKNAAMNFAGAVEAGAFVIQHARQQHEAIRGEVRVAKRGRVTHEVGVEHRLEHGGSLSPPGRASNVSFQTGLFYIKNRIG